MNIPSAKCMTPSPVVLSDDLIIELLSFLPVRTLFRFRCVSKSWKTLISDPAFIKLHLNRSAIQNPHMTLITHYFTNILGHSSDDDDDDCFHHCSSSDDEEDESVFGNRVTPCSLQCLIENPSSFTLSIDPYYLLKNNKCFRMIGTCNGLILLAGCYKNHKYDYQEHWFRLWNPATRTTSPKFGYLREPLFAEFLAPDHGHFIFKFGCDNSTGTYKVVASRYKKCQETSNVKIINVKILSVGDNVWRDIESFPVIPLKLNYCWNNGVYLSGTLNWLAIRNEKDIENRKVEQLVIVSLDLGAEHCTQYRLPLGFDEVPPAEPMVGVLGGCLCFSYSSYKESEFVLWQMKKFGIEESWSQFLKISFQNLQIHYDFSDEEYSISDDDIEYHFPLTPLLLFEEDHTLVLIFNSIQERRPFLYNWRDNRVERIQTIASSTFTNNRTRDFISWGSTMVFVESLVSTF